jgi:hypothetical protein
MGLKLDRAPVSVTKIKQVSGSDTLVDGSDSGTISLALELPTGLFSGRIKATGLEAAPAALTVGWGFASLNRKLPVYINNTAVDYAVSNYQRFAAFDTSDISDATEYAFWLTDPDDPKELPLIPDGEPLLIYLTYTGTAGDSVLVEVEVDYESWTDKATEVE